MENNSENRLNTQNRITFLKGMATIMKKFISLLMILILVFTLVACGKSSDAIAAEEAIAAIGEVTLDKTEAIELAEKLYNILTDEEKQSISNRLDLVNAREALDTLLKAEADKLAEEQAAKDKENQKAIYKNAKSAYDDLNTAADLCIEGMDKIYAAWMYGIYDADDAKFPYSGLASVIGFKENATWEIIYDMNLDPHDLSFSDCVNVTIKLCTVAGMYEEITDLLKSAESDMKELNDEYSDYTFYPKLKEYYAEIQSYYNFFKKPTGSFEQLKTTINDYENTIRTLKNDIGFLF